MRSIAKRVPGRLFALLAVLSAACAPRGPAASVPPPSVVHAGDRFAVYCHFDCGAAGATALLAAEAAWRHAVVLVGGATRDTERRPIHLYATERDYEAVEEALTGGRFRVNRAMSYRGREAHIAVHPNLTPAALAEFGLTTNTLRVVAHEAAHIALRTLAPRSRDLPDWLDEGIAAALEQDVLADLGFAVRRWDEPVAGTRAYQLQDRLRRGTLPPLGKLLEGDEGNLTLGERYAFYQVFFDFLRAGPHADALLRTLRRLEELEASGAPLRRDLVRALFGTESAALGTVDAEFRSFVRRLRPGWVQARRALSLADSVWLQVGFDGGAEAWRWLPVPTLPYTLTGQARILAGGSHRAAILIALEAGERLALTFLPGELRVERHLHPGDPAPRILLATPADILLDRPVTFRIAVDAGGITVGVGNVRDLRVRSAPVGRWGLEAGPAANVAWLDLAVNGTPVR